MENDQFSHYHKFPYLWPLDGGGFVATDRIVAVGKYRSAPIRRSANEAKRKGRLVDLTYGKSSEWVLFLDSGHLVLSSGAIPFMIIDEPEFTDFLIRSHGEK